jgi:hypothetical protein
MDDPLLEPALNKKRFLSATEKLQREINPIKATKANSAQEAFWNKKYKN